MVPPNNTTPKPGVLAKQAVLKWLQTPEQERPSIQKAAEDGGVSKQVFSYHYTLLKECGQAQLLAHSLVSEGAAPVQKKGRKRGPQPKADTGYNGSGAPWEEYKEVSKRLSKAVAGKELSVRKAEGGALAPGVKLSKTTIARHAKGHPGKIPNQKGGNMLIPKQILEHEAATTLELRKQKLPVFKDAVIGRLRQYVSRLPEVAAQFVEADTPEYHKQWNNCYYYFLETHGMNTKGQRPLEQSTVQS